MLHQPVGSKCCADTVPLRRATQPFVQNWAAQYNPATASQEEAASARATPTGASPTPYVTDSLLTKIKKYVIDIKQTPFQQDLVSAPASQAFVERMFSVWTAVIWPEKQSNHISGASVLLNINKKLLLDGSTPISLFLTHS
ncbi:hypothetical protein N1851_025861 [Merluccius polli]|uniref:Uncharacterized protein n=1 Tax=Merluccius polli TaxID=89951 RepID=A0AA47MCY8_MERPO|nr:hypothetical protein N1851_025861 [Merluccius polli]